MKRVHLSLDPPVSAGKFILWEGVEGHRSQDWPLRQPYSGLCPWTWSDSTLWSSKDRWNQPAEQLCLSAIIKDLTVRAQETSTTSLP